VNLSDAISAVMADFNVGRSKPLRVLMGEKHLGEQDKPPRVIWMPQSDSFKPTKLAGGTPRPLWDLVTTYSIHIWGPDIDGARQLEMDLVASLHRVMHSADALRSLRFEPLGAVWHNIGELQSHGVQLELTVAFTLQVLDRPATTRTPTTVTGALSESDTGGTINVQVP
jgi:hypothetical protein